MERNDTMSHTTEATSNDQYISDDVQAVAEYRSVSLLAVLAVILGVASASAMVTDSLLIVPLLGIIISLLALWRIARSDGQQVGRSLALVGLALSLAIGAGVYVRGMTLKRLLAEESQTWGAEWCDLLMDDEVVTALELTVPPNSQRPFNDSLQEYYATNDAAAKRLQEFEEEELVKALRAAPEGSKIVAGAVKGFAPAEQGSFLVLQQFEMQPPVGEGNPVRFQLQLKRVRLRGIGGNAWYLSQKSMGW